MPHLRPQPSANLLEEERFRLALGAVRGHLFDWDRETDHIWRSSGIGELLGFRAEELAPTTEWWTSRTHPEDLVSQRSGADAAAAAREERLHSEYRVRHRDGHWIWVRSESRLYYDDQPQPRRIVGFTYSIDERKRAELRLAESEERHRLLAETMLHGVVHQGADGTIIAMNPAAERILGKTREQFLGSSSEQEEHDTIREDGTPFPGTEHPTMVALQTGKPVRQTIMGVRQPQRGEYRWISIDAIPLAFDSASRPTEVYAVFEDITERRRVEAALRQSEERLRLAAGTAMFGVHDYDLRQRVSVWTSELYALTGIDPVVPIDLARAVDLIHPEDRERIDAAIRVALDPTGSGQFSEEFRIVRADNGQTRWFFNRAQTLFEELDGRRVAVRNIGIISDITERRTTREQLQQAVEQLQSAGQRRDQFLALLAHELRNPLAPIRYAVRTLQAPRATEPQRSDAREVIERQVTHMARLVDDLLDVSRVTQGKVTLVKSIVDWVDVVHAGVELSRPLIDARHHELALLLPPRGTVCSEGDPTRLAQVVGNLLTNAAKYTDPGGRIEVKLAAAGGEARLVVADNGIGIAAEVLPQVFEPFVQAQHSLDRAQGGLGIGLSLVRSLVELHGGRVEAASAGAALGSRFTLYVPLARAQRTAPQSLPAPAPVQRRRVLVVDDNVDAAQSLRMLLELEGHEVRLAHDGLAALEAARAFAPAVVLLDIGLPGLDGYEVARRLRAAPETRACRLIAITGYGQSDDHARSEAAGFDRHLIKPVEPERVLALIGDRST